MLDTDEAAPICPQCRERPRTRLDPDSEHTFSVYCRICHNERTAAINKRKRDEKHYFDPVKQPAREKLVRAVRRGDLTRGACAMCHGSEKPTDGHHFDYSRPLDVIWLCRKCHTLVDQMLGERLAGKRRRLFIDVHYPSQVA